MKIACLMSSPNFTKVSWNRRLFRMSSVLNFNKRHSSDWCVFSKWQKWISSPTGCIGTSEQLITVRRLYVTVSKLNNVNIKYRARALLTFNAGFQQIQIEDILKYWSCQSTCFPHISRLLYNVYRRTEPRKFYNSHGSTFLQNVLTCTLYSRLHVYSIFESKIQTCQSRRHAWGYY